MATDSLRVVLKASAILPIGCTYFAAGASYEDMSANFSLIIAEAPLGAFTRSLRRRADLTQIGQPARRPNLHFDADTGNQYIGLAEHEGRAYLLDHYSAAISGEVDLITDLSRDLQATVVGCDVSSVSGHYTFVLARDGKLLRYHSNSYGSYDAPYEVGEPLTSEQLDPLEDVDGVGIRLAVREAGFAVEPIDLLEFTPYELRQLEPYDGRHSEDYAAFLKDHWFNSPYEPPVQIRRQDGSVELAPPQSRLPRGEVGHVPMPQARPVPARSWTERIRRYLRRT